MTVETHRSPIEDHALLVFAKDRLWVTKQMHTARLQSRVLPAGTFSTKDALDDGNAYGSALCIAAAEQLIAPAAAVNDVARQAQHPLSTHGCSWDVGLSFSQSSSRQTDHGERQ